MACCAKLRPLWVSVCDGASIQNVPCFTFAPVYEERDDIVGMWIALEQRRQDWEEAFEDSPVTPFPLVEFPDELKQECYDLDGTKTFTIRFEFPDSADCGGDTFVHSALSMRLRIEACRPITIKAAIEGNVSDSELRSLESGTGIFRNTAGVAHYCNIRVYHPSPHVDYCNDYTGSPTVLLALGHSLQSGDQCDMARYVNCGVTEICEGLHYLDLLINSWDGHLSVGAFWEVTLTFACDDEALDCSAEEADPDYHPLDEEEEPPCAPDDEEPEPCDHPPLPTPGDCFCNQCKVRAFEVDITGLVNSTCSYFPVGPTQVSLAENMNRTFYLSWKQDQLAWTQELGTLHTLGDEGYQVGEAIFPLPEEAEQERTVYETWCYRIGCNISCQEIDDELRWTAQLTMDFHCYAYDEPLGRPFGSWVSSVSCVNCSRMASISEPVSYVDGVGCNGYVVISNLINDIVKEVGANICDCSNDPEGSAAYAVVRPLGESQECEEE